MDADAALQPMLERITFRPEVPQLNRIDWPSDPPEPAADYPQAAGGALPAADVLVITWTKAEQMALADVLTPGVHADSWHRYHRNWGDFESQLTGRSPAREAGCLGEYMVTRIGGQIVCLLHSELHPATDASTLPAARLAAQAARETDAHLVITTGTAGGAGNGTLLGDVNVADVIHADFTTRLKGHSWSKQAWLCAAVSDSQHNYLDAAQSLFAANSGRLPGAPRPPQLWAGHVVSTDFFAFDTDDDHWGLRAYDPEIRAVEMDDAAVAYGCEQAAVQVLSVRNASDPVMPDGSEASEQSASATYRRYGYWTTVNSAIATWAVIAGLD